MRFTCDRGALSTASASASRATAVRSPVPALEGLLIEAELNGMVQITGYDLKTGIKCEIPAVVEEAGSTVLTARLICDIVRMLPGDSVCLTTSQNGKTTIESGNAKYELLSGSGDDYPDLPQFDGQSSFLISSKKLKDLISQTVFAVSASEVRPVYMGELFEIEDNKLTVVAVDGQRLALRRESIDSGTEYLSFIVPGSALSEVEKLLQYDDSNVEVICCQKHVVFKMADSILFSRRLEGEFLSYKAAIPENGKYNYALETSELADAVERVSIIFSGESTRNALRMKFADGKLNLYALSAAGQAQDEIDIEGVSDELELGFNHKYISDAIKAAPSDRLIWRVSSPVSPSVFVPEDGDESFIYMILPVRLSQSE